MTPEQLERKRKYNREYSARKYAEVKDTQEFKAKCKLASQNRTEEQRARKQKSNRENAARWLAKDPEKVKAYHRAYKRKMYEESPEKVLKRSSAWKKANVARVAANQVKWRNTDMGYLSSCKGNLARQSGVAAKDLPDELVAAKFAQLKVRKLIRDLG